MIRIVVVHGPNPNLLGEREPHIYGATTLQQVNDAIRSLAQDLGIESKFFQSNHEGALIDFLHENREWANGIVINPGALTHYSYALRDAIAAVYLPAVEVHLSDISKREPFRKVSVTGEVCLKQFFGRGLDSYLDGVKFLAEHLSE